jgi:hypothetical protein
MKSKSSMDKEKQLYEELIDILIQKGFDMWLDPDTDERMYVKGSVRVIITLEAHTEKP